MTYSCPREIEDALTLLELPGAKVLAGGTDVYPGLAGAELCGNVVDLSRVSALRGISQTPDGWRIGATTRWVEVLRAELPPAFDALKQAAAQVGSVQIQNRATVAGNICNASPAADGVPALLVLDAEVELVSRTGTRRMALGEFLTGVRTTMLKPGEILAAVHVPESAVRGRSVFAKLGAREHLVISIAMVATRVEHVEGIVQSAAISVGACSPVAARLSGLEAALVGGPPEIHGEIQDAIRSEVERRLSPIGDVRASAEYRRNAAIELVSRTLEQAMQS